MIRSASFRLASGPIVDRIDPASLDGSADSGMLVRCTTFDRLIPATDWLTPRNTTTWPRSVPT